MIKKTICVFACLCLAGCDLIEMSSREYDNYKAAADSQALGEWKWLPGGLPRSALNIKETHDMDTNEVWFSYEDPTRAVPTGCARTTAESVSPPRAKGPPHVRHLAEKAKLLLASRVAPVYACQGESYRYVVAVDESLNSIVGWSVGEDREQIGQKAEGRGIAAIL